MLWAMFGVTAAVCQRLIWLQGECVLYWVSGDKALWKVTSGSTKQNKKRTVCDCSFFLRDNNEKKNIHSAAEKSIKCHLRAY